MKLAFLSGKGGAGKTFLAVNFASYLQVKTENDKKSVAYFDCDVEEPNGHLFFSFPIEEVKTIYTFIPEIEKNRCVGCRKCVTFCRFNALAFIKKMPVLLPELCHACGGCTIVCPEHCIAEKKRAIGNIEKRQYKNLSCYSGILNIGESNGIKIIHNLLENAEHDYSIIDCPPGSACSVMESISDADLCILAAEPTSFGLHNLNMVYELTKVLHKKTAVIINKAQEIPYTPLIDFCNQNKLPILSQIPFDKKLAKMLSEGKIAYWENKNFAEQLENVYKTIKAML